MFLGSDLKVGIGQKVIIRNGTGKNGKYRSIISSYAAIAPRIWGEHSRIENDIENYADSKKGRKEIKELRSGQYFTIKKIVLMGKKQKYHYYLAFLTSDNHDYKCDIGLALKLKELSLVQ